MEQKDIFNGIEAVLFDLDGVLLDTEGIYTRFWSEMDREYPTGVENFAQVIKGSTLPSIYARYFPDKAVQADITRRLRQFEANMPYVLFDGVERLLAALHARGIKMAIVTSSNRSKMETVFAEVPVLKRYIDTLVTDEDVTASKPDPQGYLLAAKRLGADPHKCMVFEDSVNGLRAGRAAGAVVVGIATTNSMETIRPLCDIALPSIDKFRDRV